MIELFFGFFLGGFFIAVKIMSYIHRNDYDDGYKNALAYAKNYWEPLLQKEKQRNFVDWILGGR